MKTIKRFETNERLVILGYYEYDKAHPYTVSILTHDNRSTGKTYKSRYYAERKFGEYKDYPLEALEVK